MRFWSGFVIGMLVGGAGVYAGLERPWEAATTAEAPPDAAVEAASDDSKSRKQRSSKRRKRENDDGTSAETEIVDEVPELSAADRMLVWKGDTVALPKRSVDFSSNGEARPLEPSEINQAIRGQSDTMLECITTARGNAPLDAQITVEMLVDGTGKPSKVRMRAPAYLFEHGFYGCARKAALSMRFPATGAPTVVTAPYDLY